MDLYDTTEADIAGLHYLKGVRFLELRGRYFSIDGLRELRWLPELEALLLPDKDPSREESIGSTGFFRTAVAAVIDDQDAITPATK